MKHVLVVLCEIFQIWCICGIYVSASFCEFYFGSLDMNMTVRSDVAVGSRIHGIYIEGIEGDYSGGLTLSSASQYFYLDDQSRKKMTGEKKIIPTTHTCTYYMHRDIRVSTCLPTGLAETLEIRMTGLSSTSCAPGYLHIEVIPTIPALKTSKFADSGPGGLGGPLSAMSTGSPPSVIPQHYDIMLNVCSAEAVIDLFQIDFFNEGECVSFNCSVACTNDNKIFWMAQEKDRLIQTSINGIIFNFIYELNITCRESGLSVDIMDFDASDTFELTFVKACVTAENNTAQPSPTLASKSAPRHNSSTPIIQETTLLFTTEAPHQGSSMLHNQATKATFSLPQSALTDNANMSIQTETTSLLPTESAQSTVSTHSIFSCSTPIPTETEYPSMKYINSTVDAPLIVETSSIIFSTSALSGATLIKTSDLPKQISNDNDKEGTIIVPVVTSIAGVALLSVIGVIVCSLVSKQCRIMPLLRKKGKIEDREDTKNNNRTEDPEHGHQRTELISHA